MKSAPFRSFALVGAGLLTGVAGTIAANKLLVVSNDVWFAVESPSHLAFDYPTDQLPFDIQNLTGRVRLIAALDDTRMLQAGYILEVALKALSTVTFPTECRPVKEVRRIDTPRPAHVRGIWLGASQTIYDTEAPIHEVWLRVSPRFTLRDKNGFILASVDGVSQFVETGSEVELQGVSSDKLPQSFQSRLQTVSVEIPVSEVMCSKHAG